jgi:hypothetical protein
MTLFHALWGHPYTGAVIFLLLALLGMWVERARGSSRR